MTLELYHKIQCPYSAKVREFIEAHDLRSKIQYHETESDSKARTELQELVGKTQVPCLVVDGEPMLESDDIIEWLRENVVRH